MRNKKGQFVKGHGLGKKKSNSHTENIRKAKLGNKNPMFGVKPSKKTLEKRSIALKGKLSGSKNPMYGKSPWNKGLTKQTDKKVEKIAEAKVGKKRLDISGENHPHWKGGKPKCVDCGKSLSNYSNKRCSKCDGVYMSGERCPLWIDGRTPENQRIRHSIEYRLWRESVFARDNWTCQKYGIKGGKIEAHHIHNFADYLELRFAIDNGITLSEKAHKAFHRKYGNRNNTKEQLEEFLK